MGEKATVTEFPIQPELHDLVERVARFEEMLEDVRLSETVGVLMAVPLTIRQLKVLGFVIAGDGAVTAQKIAGVFEISLATVSGLVDRLVDGGMVIRRPNSSDHRVQDIVATDSGTSLLRELTASSNRIRTEALRQLQLDDLRALVRGLDALAAVLGLRNTSGDAAE